MTLPLPSGAFVHAAAWWDSDAGPPRAELLARDVRLTASFSTRILAHVLGHIAQRSPVPLPTLPWVLGASDATYELPPVLRRALAPTHGLACVHSGPTTVAMALLEALGHLVEHEAVLVTFVQEASSPHHEPLASALLLARVPLRSPGRQPSLVLAPPSLRRATSGSIPTADPFTVARSLARAVHVGQPTLETVSSAGPDRPDYWQIELRLPS